MHTLLLGLDVSTTGSKALLIDETGAVVASHTTPHDSSQPRPLWSEQNPADWWAGMAASIRAVLAETGGADAIQAIGLTGQMHGLVCLDAGGNVLRPAILWNDQRTQAECDQITATIGARRLIELTGNRALTGFTAPKILWVRAHEPEVYARIAHILLPKDFLRFKLTGEYATDLAGAAGTCCSNVAQRQWSQEVVGALGIPAAWLPPVHEGPQVTGAGQRGGGAGNRPARRDAGRRRRRRPVSPGDGGWRGPARHRRADRWHIRRSLRAARQLRYEPEGRLHAFCHAVPGQWHFMA